MTKTSLTQMVTEHYGNKALTQLQAEIAFDYKLSDAEVTAALRAYTKITSRDTPSTVYLPMAGPIRHVKPLLDAGVDRVIAVDLCQESFDVGLQHYGSQKRPDGTTLADHVEIYCNDVRDLGVFKPEGGFQLAISMGNSFGDVTDPVGNQALIQAMADSLTPDGVFIFDYVGTRYNPEPGNTAVFRWRDVYVADGTEIPVVDIRTRRFEPFEEGGRDGILHFTCQVKAVDTKGNPTQDVVPLHQYEKLTLTDETLERQFATAGLRLFRLGAMVNHSSYHQEKAEGLCMMGKPDHLYAAVKMLF